MNKRIERKIRDRKKYYNKHGYGLRWREKKIVTDRMISRAKETYRKKEEEKLQAEGSHQMPFRALQKLKSHDRPNEWSLNDLKPELSDAELAEELATYFNEISSEFSPISEADVPVGKNSEVIYLQPHEVSARLKSFKKPKSMVNGDIFPQCINKCHDLIAVPLTKIFNLILASKKWPKAWKMETITVIPKSTTADTFGECRNLSCTPLFSKVMESFLMDRINAEVKIDYSQYSGAKKCGTDHFLTQAWNNILTTLEDNRASVNLVTIDFAKAFNRMSHYHRLRAFKRKGATTHTLQLIGSFLMGRMMKIKVEESFSAPHPINGGSPQGCVSANALFCATYN